ncbi:MAG: flagellar motor protein MotB [Verrucomicrobiae bacterium]|nr:flagellar motor protein MotB [Verrucomicrobiae bacterium]
MSKRGGHGGAWKVAYADFVTSMMALFLVLWVVAMSQEAKQNFAGYFRSTALLKAEKRGVGMLAPITRISQNPKRIFPATPDAAGSAGGELYVTKPEGRVSMQEVAASIVKLLNRNNNEITDANLFRLEFLNDGFRLQALDNPTHPLFEKGTANLTDYGRWVLRTIAWEVERFPFRVEVEGHTQGHESAPETPVDQWTLSTNRALAAKQCLEDSGIPGSQFYRVAGYADQLPMDNEKPGSDANRRITVMLRLNYDKDMDDARSTFSTPPTP